MARIVVVLCGPPGSGKSTAAHASGLEVFDRDDAHWSSEKQFTTRLADLARDPSARAVVIRSAASSSARAKAARLVGATCTFLLSADQAELARRVRSRHRGDTVAALSAIPGWFARFDRDDNVQDFPGWPAVLDTSADLRSSEEW